MVISHDRWFLDRIATHILAFEGDSKVVLVRGQLPGLRGGQEEAAGRRGAAAEAHQVQAARPRVGGNGSQRSPLPQGERARWRGWDGLDPFLDDLMDHRDRARHTERAPQFDRDPRRRRPHLLRLLARPRDRSLNRFEDRRRMDADRSPHGRVRSLAVSPRRSRGSSSRRHLRSAHHVDPVARPPRKAPVDRPCAVHHARSRSSGVTASRWSAGSIVATGDDFSPGKENWAPDVPVIWRTSRAGVFLPGERSGAPCSRTKAACADAQCDAGPRGGR